MAGGSMLPSKDGDLDAAIDGQRVRPRTILFLAVVTLAMLGDGFDLSAIGYVTPELARQWHVSPGSLSPMLSAGIIGLLVGAPILGLMGDRLGRKSAIVGGLCIVGVASLLTAFADTMPQFIGLRFITGLGLGGVIPNIIALTAEVAPRRLRGMFVVIVNFGVPAGISLPGLAAARFVPVYGWPILMVIGGVLPLLIAALIAAVMPESIRFLARRGDRPADVARELRRLRPDLSADEAARIARPAPALSPAVALPHAPAGAGSVRLLFQGSLAGITPILWVTLAANQMVNFFSLSWLPTLLQKAGSTTAQAGISASMFSLGGMAGGLCLLFLIDRFGVVPMVVLFFLGVPTLAAIGTPGLSVGELSLVIAFAGFCVTGNNFGMSATLGMIYPTPVRSLGAGWAQAMGRAGSLAAPVLGGLLLEMQLPLQDLVLAPAGAMSIGAAGSVVLALLCLRRFGSLRVHEAAGREGGRRRDPAMAGATATLAGEVVSAAVMQDLPPPGLDALVPRYPIGGVTYRTPGYARDQIANGNWLDLSIGDSLRRTAARVPDKAAVIDPAGATSFAELDRRSESVAASLMEAGLRPGDRVLFQLGTSRDYFTAFYGCAKAGIVPVCTLPQYRQAEMTHFAAVTSARAIFAQAEPGARFDQAGFARELMQSCPGLRHVIAVGGTHEGATALDTMATAFDLPAARARTADVRPGPLDVVAFQLSGGSTSLPKIIPRMHGEYLGATLQLSARYGLTGEDVTLWALPLVHNAGTLFAVLPVGLESRTLVLQPRLDMPEMLRLVGRHGVTFSGSIGPVAAKLLEVTDLHAYQLGTLRQFFSLTRADAVEAHMGVPVGQMFGMTEGMVFASAPGAPKDARHATVGHPVSPGDEVRLLRPGEDVEVPFGEVGELCFRGPSTFTGYFGDPAATAATFTPDGFCRSGDLLRAQEIGGVVCYSFEGRMKDNINRGGEKIGAEEVEGLIARHPDVMDCRVVAMPDPTFGEKACAFLIVREGCEPPTVATLGAFLLSTGIAKFKLPERVEVVDGFPLTRVGKVDKVRMRAMIAEVLARAGAPAAR